MAEGLLSGQRAGILRFLLFLTQDYDLAEEMTQETLKLVLEKGISPVNSEAYAAWLRGVAKNVFRRHLREKSSDKLVVSSDMLEVAENHFVRAASDKDETWEEERKALLTCFEKLSEANRGAFLRRYEQGQSVKDIAASMGVELKTLSKKLVRIRAALRDCVRLFLKGKQNE